jgi:hypothetical protein
MATIGEIKSGGARFAAEAQQHAARLQMVETSLKETSARLAAVVRGSEHPRLTDALAHLAEVQSKLHTAGQLAATTATQVTNYVDRF